MKWICIDLLLNTTGEHFKQLIRVCYAIASSVELEIPMVSQYLYKCTPVGSIWNLSHNPPINCVPKQHTTKNLEYKYFEWARRIKKKLRIKDHSNAWPLPSNATINQFRAFLMLKSVSISFLLPLLSTCSN